MSTKIINELDPNKGVAVLRHWIEQLNFFIYSIHSKKFFIELFGKDDGPHLWKKNHHEDFGGFFLNLDNKNQVALLKHYGNVLYVDLKFPSIMGWVDIGIKYGMDNWEEFTEEDVRNICVGFGELSEWDVYPHDLVWLRKFLLYACNHAIEDDAYLLDVCKGKKDLLFGNAKNWFKYYEYMPVENETKLCEKLITYS